MSSKKSLPSLINNRKQGSASKPIQKANSSQNIEVPINQVYKIIIKIYYINCN